MPMSGSIRAEAALLGRGVLGSRVPTMGCVGRQPIGVARMLRRYRRQQCLADEARAIRRVPPSCYVLGVQWNRRAASAIGSEDDLDAGVPRSSTSW